MDLSFYAIIILLTIGVASGLLSGFVGVGGGLIIVPALVYLLQYSQMQAQGTSLAVLLLPVGFLAVMHYYKQGNIETIPALIIGAGFVGGAFLGSYFAHKISVDKVKFVFSIIMLIASLKLLYNSYVTLFAKP